MAGPSLKRIGAAIIEGDCLEVMATLPDCSIDAIICDPPYGTTACKWDSVIPFAPMWEQLKRIAKPRAAIVLFASQPFTSALVMSNPGMFRYEWIWDKVTVTGHLNAAKMPLRRHESLLVFYDALPTYNPQMGVGVPYRVGNAKTHADGVYGITRLLDHKNSGTRHPTSIVQVTNSNKTYEKDHPTQKPVALMEYLVRTYTNEGETVLDFTCGSGTTGVACVTTGRNFIGIEQSAEYCEISRRRIADAAAQPSLLATGN